jgi:hypothetical protein
MDLLGPETLAGLTEAETLDYAIKVTDHARQSQAEASSNATRADVATTKLNQHLVSTSIQEAAQRYQAGSSKAILVPLLTQRFDPQVSADGTVTFAGKDGQRISTDATFVAMRLNPRHFNLFDDLRVGADTIPMLDGRPDTKLMSTEQLITAAREQPGLFGLKRKR